MTPIAFEPVGKRRFTLIAAVNFLGFISTASEIIELTKEVPAINFEKFENWFVHKLLPNVGSFCRREPNSVIVMDNASIHGNVNQLMITLEKNFLPENRPVILFLSPYSPDYNPIEEAFSKLKSIIRRNRDLYFSNPKFAISTAISQVTETDMIGYFKHSGYSVENNEHDEVVACGVAVGIGVCCVALASS